MERYFEERSVFLELSKVDKKGNLEDMLLALAKNNKILYTDVPELLASLIDRERMGSTGIGNGIAMPHKEHPCVTDIFVVIGRSIEGVDWESMDGTPTHLIFLVIGPEFETGKFMKTLVYISRILKNNEIRENLLACKLEDIFNVIALTKS